MSEDTVTIESSFLFAEPDFIDGIANITSLGVVSGNYNISKSPGEADLKAIKRDWISVGHDLYKAVVAETGRPVGK